MSAFSHASRFLLAGLVLWLGMGRLEALGQESAPPLIKKSLNEDEPEGPNEAVVAISKFQARYGIQLGIEKPDRIFVQEVDPKKYAARVGLEKGDTVVAIEGHPTSTMAEVVAALQHTEPLSSVEMQLRRGDKDLAVLMGKHVSLPGLVIREDASQRAYASRVSKESLEGDSDIQTDDLIMAVNDQSTPTYEQFVLIAVPTLQEMRAGEELSLQVIRDGTRHRVAIVRPEHVDLPTLDIQTTQRPDKLEHRTETREGQQVRGAVAVIYPVSREETPAAAQVTQRVRVYGEIRLEARADHELDVLGQVVGLPEGTYEVLVHQFGDCRNVVEGSVGPTFDTGDTRDRDRTPGSLGTLEVLRDGVGTMTSATESFRLNGQHSIIGRAVVVYPILNENGRLGEPLACGVIGIAK